MGKDTGRAMRQPADRAAGIHALENNVNRLEDDHENAPELAAPERSDELDGKHDPRQHGLRRPGDIDPGKLVISRIEHPDVPGATEFGLVTHLDISEAISNGLWARSRRRRLAA